MLDPRPGVPETAALHSRPHRVGAANSGPVPPLTPPLFSVVIPTLGSEANLSPLYAGLARQTLPRERFEVTVVFDGAEPAPAMRSGLEAIGARILHLPARSAPP